MLLEWVLVIFGFAMGIFYLALIVPLDKLKSVIENLDAGESEPLWLPREQTLPPYLMNVNYVYEQVAFILEAKMVHRVLSFWYSMLILLRIFKAFQSQPRLYVIQHTLTEAFVDIVHFLIMFIIVFINFSLGGYLLFGAHLDAWNTPDRALNTSFQALMGDFDYEAMYAVSPVNTIIWFVLFMILVFLIIVNMFLAIIIDSYSKVKRNSTSAITLWEQVADLYQSWRLVKT